MPSNEDSAFAAEREIGRINAFFPILPQLGNRWAASRPWEGRTVALNMHLTTLTGALVREMTLGGGEFVISAANPATTHKATVNMLRGMGLEVHTGGALGSRFKRVAERKPDLVVDVGFELVEALIKRHKAVARGIIGAVEVTKSGINRLRDQAKLPFPVININDSRLKDAVENRHGVGEAVWQGVSHLTGMHLSGRRVAVVGYGSVGRGLAAYARAAGMSVEVVERDPVRRLLAHYDGFPTPGLREALSRVGVIVTATGLKGIVDVDHITEARDGLVLLNAGHGGDEIDVSGIRKAATRADNIGNQVVRYTFEGGNRITVLGGGHPLNIVLNSGSPEPVLLHFTLLGLALEWAARGELSPGEAVVSEELESEVAVLALQALDPTAR